MKEKIWLPLGAVILLITAGISWGVIKEKVDTNEAGIIAVKHIADSNKEKLAEVQFMTKFIYNKMGGPKLD